MIMTYSLQSLEKLHLSQWDLLKGSLCREPPFFRISASVLLFLNHWLLCKWKQVSQFTNEQMDETVNPPPLTITTIFIYQFQLI